MNVENENIMFLVALPEVFAEYHITPQEYTSLESGKIFTHASKCGLMVILAGGDNRVTGLDNEGMQMYLEYVDGYSEEQWKLWGVN